MDDPSRRQDPPVVPGWSSAGDQPADPTRADRPGSSAVPGPFGPPPSGPPWQPTGALGSSTAPPGTARASASPRAVAHPGPPPRQRRRWPWVLALIVVLAGAGVAVGVALDQRETALQWRERAVALESQRDEALVRGDTLDGQLDDLAAVLATSEEDVVMLEERIRQLADEKAQAEDAATTVQVERDVVVDLTNDIAAATDALDACVDRLFDLQAASVEAFNQSAAGEPVDVEPLNEQARQTTSFCNDARTAAARASAAAQQLTAP